MYHRFLTLALWALVFSLSSGQVVASSENGEMATRPLDEGQEPPERAHVLVFRYLEGPGDGSLLVSFDPETVNRLERTLQLRLYEESWFDPEERAYRIRPVALITGSGLNPGGLRFDPRIPQEEKPFLGKISLFHEQALALEKEASALRRLGEPWMEGGARALGNEVPYGEILMDFRRRPSFVTVSWDLEMERYTLQIDRLYIIDHQIVPGLEILLKNLPAFIEKKALLRSQLQERREQAAGFFEP